MDGKLNITRALVQVRKEFKEYFLNKKIVYFNFTQEESNMIDMIFNKDHKIEKNGCLITGNIFINTSKKSIGYKEFINDEFIKFSKYDCDRSIPNIMDGFKTSQRKTMYRLLKRI